MEQDVNEQLAPPTLQTPIQTQSPEKQKTPVLLWLLIFVLAGTVSYFGYQNWQLRQQVIRIRQTPTPTASPTATPDPVADWKTYTNVSAKYEVRYPSDWKIENQASGSFGNEPPVNSRFIEIYKPQSDPTKSLGNIGFEEIGMIPPGEKSLLTKTKTVNNLTLQCYGEEVPNSKLWCFVKVPDENKYLSIHIFRNKDEEINATFDRILSTFKFTGTSDSSDGLVKVNISPNQPESMYLSLPEGATAINNIITIQSSAYVINTRIGPGLCNMDDPREVCGYTDEYTPVWKTFRIWDKKGNIFALNPQTGTTSGKSAEGFILTKQSPNTVFSRDEIDMWKKIADTLFIGN